MRGEHRCFDGQWNVLRWAREGEAPGGGTLWWNVNNVYRAAFPKATDESMDEARVFALSAMRCGSGEDADTLFSLHFMRTIAWVPEGGGDEQQPPIYVGEQMEYKLDLLSKVSPQHFNWLQTARERKQTTTSLVAILYPRKWGSYMPVYARIRPI